MLCYLLTQLWKQLNPAGFEAFICENILRLRGSLFEDPLDLLCFVCTI